MKVCFMIQMKCQLMLSIISLTFFFACTPNGFSIVDVVIPFLVDENMNQFLICIPSEYDSFRPIALANFKFKIITKIMSDIGFLFGKPLNMNGAP